MVSSSLLGDTDPESAGVLMPVFSGDAGSSATFMLNGLNYAIGR